MWLGDWCLWSVCLYCGDFFDQLSDCDQLKEDRASLSLPCEAELRQNSDSSRFASR